MTTAGAPQTTPVVGHLIRGYLAPTETFVGNQVVSPRRFRPLVACHHFTTGHGYPVERLVSAADLLPPHLRALDRLAYRSARALLPAAARRLASWLRRHDARFLHFHFLVDARFFLAVKRLTGLPALASAYGHDVSTFPGWYFGYGRRYLQPLFREVEMIVAMSQDMRRDLLRLGCPAGKIIVHYYGTDTRRFAYPQRSYHDKPEVDVLACGSLEMKKAQDVVLEALRRAETQGMLDRRFRVTLVGDGPLRRALERQVAAYGWQDRVRFHGHVPHHQPDLVAAYRQADVFTLPSITTPDGDKEGIPGTIVEAMACGLPVVSTYHAGIPEIVSSERDGLLVQERDVAGLALSLARLINDASLRARLGSAAAERARRTLDLQQGTAELEALYDRLLEPRPAARKS